MKHVAPIGWGVVIYAVVALSWSAISVYGLTSSPLAIVLQLVVLTVIASAATRSLRFHDRHDVLPYSLTWAGVALALDILFKSPIFGLAFLTDWTAWVGYALIVIIPLLTLEKPAPVTLP